MTPKYEAARAVMNEAQRAFDKITADFRAGKITADEYCAGRNVHAFAEAEFDAAFDEEANADWDEEANANQAQG